MGLNTVKVCSFDRYVKIQFYSRVNWRVVVDILREGSVSLFNHSLTRDEACSSKNLVTDYPDMQGRKSGK